MTFKRTRICRAALAAIGGAVALTALPSGLYAQERIEITGSRIKRVDAEGALPVDTLTREEIARAGYQSTAELLNSLAATSMIGGTQISEGAGVSIYGVSSISLRGLGEDRTLVLVNGRRLAAQAGAGGTTINVNTIPLAAIERVEILKDGASSVYGSDAVAGVVNFILRKDYTGAEIGVTAGRPTRSGGGGNGRVSLVGGFGDVATDRFNITASASFERDKALFGRDRDFARNSTVLPFFVGGATGSGNIEGGYTPGDGTPWTSAQEAARRLPGFGNSPGTGYGNPLAAQDRCEDIKMRLNPTPTTKGMPFCYYDTASDVGLLPDRELTNFSANFVFQLAKDHELFADALYGRSKVTHEYQPSPLRRSFNLTNLRFAQLGIDPALLVRPNNPHYSIAADYLAANGFGDLVGQTLAFTSRVFDFGGRTNEDTSTQTRFVLGARGMLGAGIDYEAAFARNESKLRGRAINGYFNTTRFVEVVNRPDSDYNPWSLQQSETFRQRLAEADAKYVGPTLNAKSTSDQVDGLLRGDVFAMGGGAAQYAAGAQYRREKYKNDPSDALFSGEISGLGGAVPPVDESRNATAFFGELNLPIAKGIEATVGARHDRYSDAGNANTYKASAGWRPFAGLLLRANVGTGFRAPSMEELYEPQTLGTSEIFNDPVTGQNAIQVNALSGGNPELKPEKSRQSSIGAVWQATDAFSVGVDFWRVRISDAIAQPSAQLVASRAAQGDPAYVDKIVRDANGDIETIELVLDNTGQLRVSGIDLTLAFNQRVGDGRLDVSLNGTYMSRFDETTPSGEISKKVGTTVDLDGDPVIGAEDGGVVLKWKHVLSGTYSLGPWAFTAAQNFYKGYEMGNDLNGVRRFVPSRATYDMNLTYSGIKNAVLAVGVKNVFDSDPPIYIPVNNQFQSGYDASLEDPRRRFIYVTANYKFW